MKIKKIQLEKLESNKFNFKQIEGLNNPMPVTKGTEYGIPIIDEVTKERKTIKLINGVLTII